MGIRKWYSPNDAPLTLEQWRALNLTRPYTDPAIGGMTDGRRSQDAFCSTLFDTPDAFEIRARHNPTEPDIHAKDREYADRRRAKARARKAAGTSTTPHTQESP